MTEPLHVYVGQGGHVSALHADSGELLWQVRLAAHDGCAECDGQTVQLSISDPDKIIAACAGHVFALQAVNGALLWHRSLRERGDFSTSLLVATGDGSPAL